MQLQTNSALSRQQALAQLTAPGQPYELETQTIAGRALRVFRNAPESLRALYEQTASELTFLVYGDERLSFAQAHERAAQIAHVLVHEYGVRAGDRVAIAMRNYPEWVLAFSAITSIGAVAVAMNALWQPEEMAYALQDSEALVLFADRERLERLAACDGLAALVQSTGLRVLAVRIDPDAVIAPASVPTSAQAQIPVQAPSQARTASPALSQVWARLAPCAPQVLSRLVQSLGPVPMPAASIAPDDPATIFYTSGSTGHPKGVVSSHRSILTALLSWELDGQCALLLTGAEPLPSIPQAGALLGIPLFHVTASHAVYLMSYRAQRKLVSLYKWDPVLAAELIERERLTTFIGPAAVTGDLVRLARETGRDLSSLLAVGGGGAPRAPEQVLAIDEVFPNALPGTGWGMTETNAIGTGIGGADYLHRPASSGRCSAVMDIRIVGDDGRELPVGERGELQVRGTGMFSGYWRRPELNATIFDDGWFRTGDVAYLDDEGFLFIVDRIKDLIIRGGENIGCGHVEAALLMHPQVHEAAVYAVPDERLGEEVGATLYADAALDADELRAFLAAHLAAFEIPRYVRCEAAPLPRTASGKILKRELREQAVSKIVGRDA